MANLGHISDDGNVDQTVLDLRIEGAGPPYLWLFFQRPIFETRRVR